jgi:Insertion element 4 transposase N-terminal
MSYRLRYLAPEDKDCQHLKLDLLEQIIPLQAIEQVLDETQRWQQRVRKLSMVSMIYFVIALGIWANLSYQQVLYKLSQALRFLRRQSCAQLPTSHALSTRRQQLGSLPLQLLFERCCRVRATPETPGAFRFGLRVMALDSTIENVPDTAANATAFGRPSSQYGPGAFPQIKGTYLLECGTHLLVAAQFTPWRHNERLVAPELLLHLPTDALLTWVGCGSAQLRVGAPTRRRLASPPPEPLARRYCHPHRQSLARWQLSDRLAAGVSTSQGSGAAAAAGGRVHDHRSGFAGLWPTPSPAHQSARSRARLGF